MYNTFIYDSIKLRLKRHRVYFRKPVELKNYETAILGIVASYEGEIGYLELGKILGFALENDPNLNLRKDIAEIEIFEAYLNDLKAFHLLDYNDELITLSEWGKKSLEENIKFKFYIGNVQIPEFFDIDLIDEAFIIPSWEIGVPAIIIDPVQTNSIWSSAINSTNQRKEYKFFKENYKYDEQLFIDNIEQTSDYTTHLVELKFTMKSNQLLVLFANDRIDFLEELINSEVNNIKKEEISKRIKLKDYLDSNSDIEVEYLEQFLSIIDWEIIFTSGKLKWNLSSIYKLVGCQVSWLAISENCPLDVLFETIESLKKDVDWSVLSKRCDNKFIFSCLDKFDWDLEILLSRISIDEFREHFEKLILTDEIDFETFYLQLDEEFIIQNIEKLPRITDIILTQRQGLLNQLIPAFIHLEWNWNHLVTNVSLTFILENIKSISDYIDFDIIIMRVYSEKDNISDEMLEYILNNISDDFDYLINSQTHLNLTLSQIELLDSKYMIYWGDEKVKGFEVNTNQEWTSDIVNKYIDKWAYSFGEEFISKNIRDLSSLAIMPLRWNFENLSLNVYLCSQPSFLIENAIFLNWEKVIPIISNKLLISNFQLIKFSEDFTPEKIADIISFRMSFEELLELSDKKNDSFHSILDFLNWQQLIDGCSSDFLIHFIETNQDTYFLFKQNDQFINVISSIIPVEKILEMEDLKWDWRFVTREALKQDLINEQNIYDYSHLWDWQILIENYYQPEQFLLENDLPELATLISMSKDEQNIKRAWRFITSNYPHHLIWNAINVSSNIDLIKWDWDFLSSSNRMPLSINTLEQYADKINWDAFSGNNFLNKLFRNDKELFSSRQVWEIHVIKYLDRFKDKWNFDRLSLINNINGNARIINHFKDYWDWQVLSSDRSSLLTKGINKNKKIDIENFRLFSRKIDFDILSSRNDLKIDLIFIQKFINENWNWKLLSVNPSVYFDTKLFFENFLEKEWDWFEISKNKSIDFDNSKLLKLRDKNLDWSFFSLSSWLDRKTIFQLKEKSWNWKYISKNQEIYFDADLLNLFSDKNDVDWKSILKSKNLKFDLESLTILSQLFSTSSEEWNLISRNKVLDINDVDLLFTFKDYWDWDYFITEFNLDFNNIKILDTFSDKIDWNLLSQNKKFIPILSILNKYKQQLNWYYITPRFNFSDIDFTNKLVQEFGGFLDWTHICSTANFKGNIEFISKYYAFMDLYKLINNPSIDITIYNFVREKLESDIYSLFAYKLNEQNSPWSGFVYHFTHLTNAIEIIKNRKILSRNLAQLESSKFSDAAGSVVHRRDTAHEYARFYFRPKTPTQFYNECLGKDINDGNYYIKANGLGLPKCPVPIFFKFDLEEIFSVMGEKCYVSNGNLQKNNTKIGTISEMYNKFNFEHVYSSINTSGVNEYMQWSQQEFLISEYFDFSKLKKYEILVMNESDLAQLNKIFENDMEILSKTRIARYDDEIFISANKKVNYSLKGKVLSVSTDYEGNGISKGMFTLKFDSKKYIIRNGIPQYASADSLTFYPSIEIEFEDKVCFNLFFKDYVTKKDPWEIIKYCNVD